MSSHLYTVYQGLPSPPQPPSCMSAAELDSAPTHLDLMNMIAANIPTKWREVGLQLGLRVADLNSIEMRHAGDCNRYFSSVFSMWEGQLTKPFTWSTIVQVLRSPLIGECRLAQEVEHSFIQPAISPQYKLVLVCTHYVHAHFM